MSIKDKITLDDDTFTKTAEALIQRDFFPELSKLKAQTALLDALENGSSQESDRKAMEALDKLEAEQRQKVDITGMTLDDFLHRYTSEDNVSFDELFQKHREQHRRKHAWMFNPEDAYKRRLLQSGGEVALLEYKKEEEEKRKELSERKLLMLPPPPRPPKSQELTVYQVEHPKEINYSGTHFSGVVHQTGKNLTEFAAKPLERTVWGELNNELAVLAQRKLQRDQGAYDLDDYNATPRSMVLPSPRINGYGFVRTPQFSPGQGEVTPLMTWGTIATPTILSVDPNEYLSGPKFSIGTTSKREEVGHQLADQAAQRMRSEKVPLKKMVPGIRTPSRSSLFSAQRTTTGRPVPSPSPSINQSVPLSPAARVLAEKLGKLRPSSELFTPKHTPKRQKVEPSPSVVGGRSGRDETLTPGAPASRRAAAAGEGKPTKGAGESSSSSSSKNSNPSLTDGLLQF